MLEPLLPLLPEVPLVSLEPDDPVDPADEPLLPLEVPLIPPVLPVVEPDPVLMSVPASRPEARGSVALRRPSGELALLPLVPVAVPPERPLLLHAPTPAIIAAADAKVIHLRSVMCRPLLKVSRPET